MPSELAPIAIFCYNRPQHFSLTVEALRKNPLAQHSDLIVFSDGPKSEQESLLVEEIRTMVATLHGFKSIQLFPSQTNKGLARSVIEGVSQVLQRYENIIVLEDDMVCTTDFLDYMNDALRTYVKRLDIFSITGYTPPFHIPRAYGEDTYLAPRASSWGWGTWRDRWQKADWLVHDFETILNDTTARARLTQGGEDLWPMLVKQQKGIINSWAIRWTLTQSRHHAFGLYPVHSKIQNIGTDGTGTNFTFSTNAHTQQLHEGTVRLNPEIAPEPSVLAAFRNYYRLPWKVRLKNRLKYGI